MSPKLIIAVEHPDAFTLWAAAFHSTAGATVIRGAPSELLMRADLDAVLLLGAMAHERFGGRPQVGRSQVLSSGGRAGVPRWVVTVPSTSGRAEIRTAEGGRREVVVVPERTLAPEEQATVALEESLRAIREHNAERSGEEILTLGVAPEILGLVSPPPPHAIARMLSGST